MRSFALVAAIAAVAAAVFALAAQADSIGPPWGPETPNFNLEVVMRPAPDGPANGFGLVRFRQPNDAQKIVYLDTWIRDLAPSRAYELQRAVDTVVNDDCVGTNWAPLGMGMAPQAVVTDGRGTGRASLWRDVSSTALGTTFDIHFRVIDGVSKAVVLESGCYQYTVSQ
jgi:hypothetical protein